jgi:hypothetical protein
MIRSRARCARTALAFPAAVAARGPIRAAQACFLNMVHHPRAPARSLVDCDSLHDPARIARAAAAWRHPLSASEALPD